MCRIALSVINLLEFHGLLHDFIDNCDYTNGTTIIDTNSGIIWSESKFGADYEEIYRANSKKHPLFGYIRSVYFKSFNYFQYELSNKTLNN